MKKFGLIIILLLALLAKATIGYTAEQDHEIIDLAGAVEKQDLAIEQWEVTVKEEVNRPKAKKQVRQLKNRYSVAKQEEEDVVKYSFQDTHNSDDLSEYFKVIIPEDPEYNAEVIAVISGEKWNEAIKKRYVSTINALPEKMFTNQAHEFACLTTHTNGKINSDDFLETYKQDLNIEQVSTQTDNVQHSTVKKIIYGYTPLWKQSINIENETLNVQIAVSGNKRNTKLTIGTPILINEY